MCGICGVIDFDGSEPRGEVVNLASAMAARLTHRGPDDIGTWGDPRLPVAFGHTRLSVIDLSPLGAQPMRSRDGRLVLAYNGEIYNHRELRSELEKSGARFSGSSDTEVLVEACSRWGLEETLRRLSGMFAIALWDSNEKTLSLARDRFGKKPLYYGFLGGRFVFCSELKALHEVPGFRKEIDTDSARLYGLFGFIPGTHSIYGGIKKLGAGTWLKVDATKRGQKCQDPVAYWKATDIVLNGIQERDRNAGTDNIGEVHSVIESSVKRRMAADVPLGALLSGGIDSSLVVALMQKNSKDAVQTFSVGFADPGYDESGVASSVAKHLGTEHTEITVTHDEAIDVIPKLPILYDEPFADSSQIPTYLICSTARRALTVALTGDGGDEVFGGYTRYAGGLSAWRASENLPRSVRSLLSKLIQALPSSLVNTLSQSGSKVLPSSFAQRRPGDQLRKLASVLSSTDLVEFYGRLISIGEGVNARNIAGDVSKLLPSIGNLDSYTTVDWLMAADTLLYLPDDVLTKVDRASMGVGLEIRSPFLDHELFESAWRLPQTDKIRHGLGKWCLRELLSRYLPRELFERPKSGFAVPLGAWLRGPLKEWVEELLSAEMLTKSNAVEALGFTDRARVRRMWEEHKSQTKNREHQLWNILMYQAWHEAWIQ